MLTSRKRGQLLAALLSTLTASLLISGAPAASADTYTASISGTITGPTGAELSQMWVTAFAVNGTGLNPTGYAPVASDGTYTLSGLPAGTYNIEYTDNGYLDSNNVKHAANYLINQWSNGIMLADAQAKTGVDITLTPALMIQGKITGPTAEAMSGVCVAAFPSTGSVSPTTAPKAAPLGIGSACDGTEVGSSAPDAVVQSDGSYVIGGLPAGTYSVRALPEFYVSSTSLQPVPFVEQWFSGKILRSTGSTVTGNGGQTLSSIDFNLRSDVTFTDVPVGTLFHDEITWLGSEGVSTGYPNGDGTNSYHPLSSVNRDAMAAFMYRLAGSPAYTAPAVSPFTDITPSTQFYKEITWLNTMKISTGYPNGDGTYSYHPLSPVNRDAMAAFLYRFAGSPAYTAPASSPFTDVATDNPFYAQINWLADTKISTGWTAPDGTRTFQPVSAVNRDAMAAFMSRYQTMDGLNK